MAHESFPSYPTLADAIEDAERVTVRWSYDNVRNLSEGQVAAIVSALRSTVSEIVPADLPIELERAFVRKMLQEVRAVMAERETPFAYGYETACEEIEERLNEAWGKAA